MTTTRDRYLQLHYGIDQKRYLEIWVAQGEKCPICGKKRKSGDPWFDLDHDHKTGRIRGILCPSDNQRLLTAARDDPKRLRAAAEYLEGQGYGFVPPEKRKTRKSSSTRYKKAPAWMGPKGVERKL